MSDARRSATGRRPQDLECASTETEHQNYCIFDRRILGIANEAERAGLIAYGGNEQHTLRGLYP
jgi:hypothetical protein